MKRALRALSPLLVVMIAVGVAVALFKTRPTPKRTRKAALPPLVEVTPIQPSRERVRVVAMGSVVPAEEVELRAEVSGRVVALSKNLVPGGRVKKGELLIRIDPRQYDLMLQEKEAAVERAEVDLALERGRQRVAQREWKLIGKKAGTDEGKALALRGPQLKSAEAAVAAAKSNLERAQLDVERTTIRAPFNGIVKDEAVDRGQLVTPQGKLGALVGTDRFWVQVSVPVSQLAWLAIPGTNASEGSKAEVVQDLGGDRSVRRTGRVVRLLGDLDPKGRMARLLVEVGDPLGLALEDPPEDHMPLLVGAYVRVQMEGRTLDRVFAVPREALRGEKQLWIADSEDTLRIREVDVAWRGRDQVYLSAGVEPGERLITSRLATPVDGMKLRISSPTKGAPAQARSEGGGAAPAQVEGRP